MWYKLNWVSCEIVLLELTVRSTEGGDTAFVKRYIGNDAQQKYFMNGNSALQWMFTDHQGSIIAVTNRNYELLARYSYDVFGAQKSHGAINETDALNFTSAQRIFDVVSDNFRGYTGHEPIKIGDDSRIIHMNGRIYDADTGRFMQTDPFVQASSNLQNYNRYSYVLNNPLSYTDPSGYLFKKLFKKVNKVFGGHLSTVIGVGFAMAGMPWVGTMVNNGLALLNGGGLKGFITGSLSSAIGNVFTGPLSGMIGRGLSLSARHLSLALIRGTLGGGFTGGVNSVFFGGSFGKGFRTGAIVGAATSSLVWGVRDYQSDKFIENNLDCGKSGCTDDLLNAIKDAGQSPTGQNLLNKFRSSNETLSVLPESTSPYNFQCGGACGPHVPTGSNTIYFDGNVQNTMLGNKSFGELVANEPWGPSMDDGTTFIHELAHTRTAGGYGDPQSYSIGPDAVSQAENKYRAWMGAPLRKDYALLSLGGVSRPVYQRTIWDKATDTW
ncbi:RHS repeat domain-containing protein [Pseudoalteromonas luteoviolacea]|uniref:RHS repeat-associated core domain protein n=1 Tax=Pseudoalteromonas luteoviolacea (strain 2ta16) TaxID=1353533 RepID=V4I1X8_PSEL2|nr:RHS repeat-associated core domain-containing protein [Pseudoalteromonas luteoviolacea]ESP94244.1 RHS repeat-associated core domain protein [Pseudoalteromonas luteoviolacea 2ta16]KZN30636.1 hypothetical protein N483_27355 [Pseudoalteromonas luteoviolacea NCIMB 1944]